MQRVSEGVLGGEHRGAAPVRGAVERELVTGALLCGGRSLRMGRDKALVELGGRPLCSYPLAALREVAGRVLVACGPRERYRELGCELVLDALDDGGPLAGLSASLDASATEWLAVLACDLPHASADVLRALLARAVERDLDACLLELERGSQPTYAIYRRTCAEPARAALAAGERRLVSFHTRTTAGRPLRVESLAHALAGECARNVNTPDELAAVELAIEAAR